MQHLSLEHYFQQYDYFEPIHDLPRTNGAISSRTSSPTGSTSTNSIGISDLPAEVLLTVFYAFQSLFTPGTMGWALVSHVCQQWRSLAISDPLLWTTIDTRRLPVAWLPAILERSQSSGLHVYIPYKSTLENAQTILNHGDRIKSLTLERTTETQMGWALRVIPYAPMLEQLILISVGSRFTIKLPFPSLTHRIRHVSARGGCRFSPKQPSAATLTSLDLRPHSTSRYTISELAVFFRELRLLQKLYLHQAMQQEAESVHPSSVGLLPDLQYVLLEESPPICTKFLRWFGLSPHHRVDIHLPSYSVSAIQGERRLNELLDHISAAQPPYTSALTSVNRWSEMYSAQHSLISACCQHVVDAPPEVKLQLVCFTQTNYISDEGTNEVNAIDARSVAQSLLRALQVLPASSLRCLDINIDGHTYIEIKTTDWITVFTHMKLLTVLRISSPQLGNLMSALMTSDESASNERDVVLPYLDHLRLTQSAKMSASSPKRPAGVWTGVVHSLRRRADRQTRRPILKSLRLEGEFVSHADANNLRWISHCVESVILD